MSKKRTRTPESAVAAWAAVFLAAILAAPASGQVANTGGGLANRAMGRLTDLNLNGPGYLYYGVNGADRGLGYIGSYMTLGGFVPLAEDDLGGVWNADLRSHLSVNGGFFSNVGAVRKQLLGGGSLLGLGIFWDYDGDLNQYPTFGEPAAIFGQFGHIYNQVGVSGELLTDWGNLRSNGYIPVGQTGFQLLTDHTPFIQNYIVAQNGLDAALGGADLELGAYIPGLADWAGMINVGGYAFGNGRYTQNYGPDAGADLVPWFGGVYTRLDLTLADNWDFSIRYNNDSFFDSTGYVRLTYRMGGSRRRNVPDQMEQPMVRNEHIVRAHETPLVAVNPENGNRPWQVVHVDSSAATGGDGTAEAPFRTLAEAENSAIVTGEEWAITYVWAGLSSTTGNIAINPYTDSFAFQNQNQFLIGSGGPLTIGTQSLNGSNLLTIPQLTATNPVLNNTDSSDNNGASVVIADGNGGATTANLEIIGSVIGIDASGNLSSGTAQPVGTTANPFGSLLAAAGGSAVRNVSIRGDGTSDVQRGVRIANLAGTTPQEPAGDIEFSDTSIDRTTSVAFQVGAFQADGQTPVPDSGGYANINYYGSITNNTAENGNFSSTLIDILATTENPSTPGVGGTINLAAAATPPGATVPNQILDVGGQGIAIRGNNSAATRGATTINIGNTTLVNTTPTAIAIQDDYAKTSITAVATPDYAYGITKTSGFATIGINGGGPEFSFNGTVNNATTPFTSAPNGPIIGIRDVDGANINITGPGVAPLLSTAEGVDIRDVGNSDIAITGADLRGTNPTNFRVLNASGTTTITATDTEITGATQQGVLLDNLSNSTEATFADLRVDLNNTGDVGIEYRDSSTSGAVTFNNTIITGATSQGVLLTNNTNSSTVFDGLEINLTSSSARGFEAVDANDVYTTGARNTIANASTTLAAIFIDGSTSLAGPGSAGLDFLTVNSGNSQATGQITGLTLGAGGAGYPVSTTLGVNVDSPAVSGGATATADADTDAAGTVTSLAVTAGGSGYNVGDLVTLPPTDPAVPVTTEATATVASTFDPVETAITINQPAGGATGAINMGAFTVGGAAGSGVNVINDGGVTVRVNGSQISP